MSQLSSADHEAYRNPEWPKFRDAYLKTHPKCAVCGATDDLQIHHIYPVSFIYKVGREDLELNFDNYMTLCETEHDHPGENHHLLIGHLGSFKSRNINVVADTAKFKSNPHTEAAIEADSGWSSEKANRPAPAEEMTQQQIDALKEELLTKFGAKPKISPLPA
jgi:5-methylcytosine-specific restriction protein A